MSFDVGQMLRGIAPTIANTLISMVPGGPLVQSALKAVGGALGLTDQTPDTIAVALQNATPEQMRALRMADQLHEIELLKEQNRAFEEELKIHGADRQNARDMAKAEIAADKSPWYAPTRRTWLSMTAVIGFFAALGAMFYITANEIELSSSAALQLGGMLGSLGTLLIMVYNFDFGSTQSGQKKDDLIARSNPPGGHNG